MQTVSSIEKGSREQKEMILKMRNSQGWQGEVWTERWTTQTPTQGLMVWLPETQLEVITQE